MLLAFNFLIKVQIRVRLQCQPLIESQFKPIISDNYYNNHHFWFELDHAQTSKLMSSLASLAVAPGAPVPQYKIKRWTVSQAFSSHDIREEGEGFVPFAIDAEKANYSNQKSDTRDVASSLSGNNQDVASSLSGNNQPLEAQLDMKVVQQEEKDIIYKKLKELALKCNVNSKCQHLSLPGDVEDATKINNLLLEEKSNPEKSVLDDVENTTVSSDLSLEDKGYPGEQVHLEDNNGQTPSPSSEYPSIIAQVV